MIFMAVPPLVEFLVHMERPLVKSDTLTSVIKLVSKGSA
jgi:hypothetical protein